MKFMIAIAISESLGTTLKTHLRFSSIGVTSAPLAAIVISGVFDSKAMSTSGMDVGVSDEPIIASTFSSVISLRMFSADLVPSDSSSSAI